MVNRQIRRAGGLGYPEGALYFDAFKLAIVCLIPWKPHTLPENIFDMFLISLIQGFSTIWPLSSYTNPPKRALK
jgi:hypothetical protein